MLLYDSYNVIYFPNNHVYHAKIKHIDARFYKSQYAIEMLTKPINNDKFKQC